MEKLKTFMRQSLFGGLIVLLPVVIVGFLIRWLFLTVTDLIQPFTNYVIGEFVLPELAADLIVIIVILGICFTVGTFVTTGIGKWLHGYFDKYLVRLAPGYKLVKEIISQVLGDPDSSPFSRGEVVRVKLFGESCETTVTGLVTDKHSDGTVTFFMPTGPNPTSGNIYHIPGHLVTYYPEASVEAMMKSIIACGAGSASLFDTNVCSVNKCEPKA